MARGEEEHVQYTRAVFDAIPLPALIVDEELRIQDFNEAAARFLGPGADIALNQLGGEAFHCLNCAPHGCGKSERCQNCTIRVGVRRAIQEGTLIRELHHAELQTPTGAVFYDVMITASLLPYTDTPRVLLILEDPSRVLQEISTRRRLRFKKTTPKDSWSARQGALSIPG